MRIHYEAALEDYADLIFRVGKRLTPNYQQTISSYLFNAFLLSGLASLPLFIYFSPNEIWLGAATLVTVFIAYLFLHRPVSEAQYKALCYQNARKALGNRQTYVAEVELLENGLRSASLDDEFVFGWKNIEEIEETENRVYFFLVGGGGCSIPKRALTSAEQTARFLAIAKTYHQSAQQLECLK